MRLIASTSTLLLIFSHEVKSLLGMLDYTSSALNKILVGINIKNKKNIIDILDDLNTTKKRFSELLNLTSLIGVDSRNAVAKRLALKEHIKIAVNCFELIIKRYTITIDYENSVPNNLLVGPLLEAELYAILLNCLSNAIKAVLAGGTTRKVSISAQKNKNFVQINIKDTGIGLKEKFFNDAFIPFISDPDGQLYSKLKNNMNPEDRYIVGTGSGLGLSIVKEILQARKGNIQFRKSSGIWRTELEVNIP